LISVAGLFLMADHFLRRENGFNLKRFSDERKGNKR
jgi:hypothetical protein